MLYIPSYENYTQIINAAKSTHKIKKFTEITPDDKEFIVLRHDIEFDIEKARQIAEIEADLGVQSTFLVQIGSGAYNAFSDENLARLRRIASLGHDVGLHYRQQSDDFLAEEIKIKLELKALEYMLPQAEWVFGCHRPKPETAYHRYHVDGAINTYSEPFFYRTDNPRAVPTRYISDSKWRWNYGEPIYQTFRDVPRIQLLTHPFQWSAKGAGMGETFHRIEVMHRIELENTFENEYERYAEIANE